MKGRFAKRLRRAGALVCALVLLWSCTVSTADFREELGGEKKFDATVHTVSALGLMTGFPDGSFGPDKTVTRGQMAKILTVLLTGKEEAPAVRCSFSDSRGHWAEGYIAYGAEKGLISGRSKEIFAPEDPVSCVEAAKLLLAAAGYDPEKSGFIGEGWDKRVDAAAAKTGLWNELLAAPSTPCLRSDMARLLYNALALRMVTWNGSDFSPEKSGQCLGEVALGLISAEGIITEADGDSFTLYLTEGKTSVLFSAANEDYSAYVGREARVLYKDYGGVFVVFPLSEGGNDRNNGEVLDPRTKEFYGCVQNGGSYYLTGSGKNEIAWFSLWDGEKTVEVHAWYEELLEAYQKYVDKEKTEVDFSLLPVVRFCHQGDNEVRMMGLPTEGSGFRAINSWSEKNGVVTFWGDSEEYPVDSNLQVFYVDFEKGEACPGGAPDSAEPVGESEDFYMNAYVIFDDETDTDGDRRRGEPMVMVCAVNGRIFDEEKNPLVWKKN